MRCARIPSFARGSGDGSVIYNSFRVYGAATTPELHHVFIGVAVAVDGSEG